MMLMVLLSAATRCYAVSPVTTVQGPPASLTMETHQFGVHLFDLTLPERPSSHTPGPLKITLTRGVFPNRFEVELAYLVLPDGRLHFRVDVPAEQEAAYDIKVVEMVKGSTWYELYSGKINQIPKTPEKSDKETGRELRRAINDAYDGMKRRGELKSAGNGRNRITEVIAKFIPAGTPFNKAEDILRQAGFNIGPREESRFIPGQFGTVCSINYFEKLLFGRVDVHVTLRPINQNDWRLVDSLEAEITVQYI
ncbi:hypothetical protein ACLB1G_01045 [Oxalobacteraceae bacterium A2-2]